MAQERKPIRTPRFELSHSQKKGQAKEENKQARALSVKLSITMMSPSSAAHAVIQHMLECYIVLFARHRIIEPLLVDHHTVMHW